MCEVWKDETNCQGCGQEVYLDEVNEAGYCQECQDLPEMPEEEEIPNCEPICPECDQLECVCDGRDPEKEPEEEVEYE